MMFIKTRTALINIAHVVSITKDYNQCLHDNTDAGWELAIYLDDGNISTCCYKDKETRDSEFDYLVAQINEDRSFIKTLMPDHELGDSND